MQNLTSVAFLSAINCVSQRCPVSSSSHQTKATGLHTKTWKNTSVFSTKLSTPCGVCACACVCTHSTCVGRGRRKKGVKGPCIKFTSFPFTLTLTQHLAQDFPGWEIKMQRKVVTFGNCHGSPGKHRPTHTRLLLISKTY